MRVLHCPQNVGGNAASLSRAERSIGLESYCIIYSPGKFGYGADWVLYGNAQSSSFKKAWLRFRVFLKALFWADWVHFNFGESLYPFRIRPGLLGRLFNVFNFFDVRMLRLVRKKVAVTFQGDDARQVDFCREHFAIHYAHELQTNDRIRLRDRERRELVRHWDRHADLIFAVNPDLLRVLPDRAEFVPYAHVDAKRVSARLRKDYSRLVVGHAPSDRVVKGTRHLVEAVNRLKAVGHPVELVLIEGLSNQEALLRYRECDVMVDQLLAGWYGGLAVEAMAMGIPVVCYIREEDLHYIPREMSEELPILNASPSDIESMLRRLVLMGQGEYESFCERSKRFVEKWHSPSRIAEAMKRAYLRSALVGRGDLD